MNSTLRINNHYTAFYLSGQHGFGMPPWVSRKKQKKRERALFFSRSILSFDFARERQSRHLVCSHSVFPKFGRPSYRVGTMPVSSVFLRYLPTYLQSYELRTFSVFIFITTFFTRFAKWIVGWPYQHTQAHVNIARSRFLSFFLASLSSPHWLSVHVPFRVPYAARNRSTNTRPEECLRRLFWL